MNNDFKILRQLQSDRGNFEWLWQRVADYVVPRRADFTITRAPGTRRDYNIYDSTATWANNQLAAGLHSLLTSQALPWFYLGVEDVQLMRRPDVQAWLEDTRNRINAVFNDPESRFQSQAHEYYIDLGSFGTAVMYVEDDNGVKFSTRFLGECYIRQTQYGAIDTLYRVFTITKDRAIVMFGEKNLPKKLMDDKDEMRLHAFVHVCVPEGSRWASRYYWQQEEFQVREGTYDSFPYLVARWAKSAMEDYGRSPAMECLSDILMVNEMRRTIIRAAHKAVSPPLLAPDGSFVQNINLKPDGINYYDITTPGGVEGIRYLESRGQFPPADKEVQDSRQAIIRAFNIDNLQLPGGYMPGATNQNTYMTATEALMRRETNLRVLGPTVARLQNEFLNPLVTRVYSILKNRRSLAPPPQALSGRGINIIYVSPLATAQRAAEADSITKALQIIGPLAANRPDILDRINGDALLEYLFEINRAPQRVLYTNDQMAAMRQKQQAQQDQEVQDNSNLATARKNLMNAQSMGKMADAFHA